MARKLVARHPESANNFHNLISFFFLKAFFLICTFCLVHKARHCKSLFQENPSATSCEALHFGTFLGSNHLPSNFVPRRYTDPINFLKSFAPYDGRSTPAAAWISPDPTSAQTQGPKPPNRTKPDLRRGKPPQIHTDNCTKQH